MNIGFVINNLANSEFSYELLNQLHKETEKSNSNSYYIFYHNIMPPVMNIPCLAMNLTGLNGFQGKAVAFNIDSAEVLGKNNSHTDNYLFLWDLPWLSNVLNYEACLELLNKFKLIVRSQSHKDNLYNYCGREDIIVVNNMEELFKCVT